MTDQPIRPAPDAFPMTAEEMHESVDHARRYDLLWVLMRNHTLRQVDQLEDEGVLPRPLGP